MKPNTFLFGWTHAKHCLKYKLLFIFIGAQSDVLLHVYSYVQKGRKVHLNCSTDSVPIGKTVEFLADDETVTNIIKLDGVCFNTIYNRVCTKDSCSCSVDDRFYTLFYSPPDYKTIISFVCKMKFGRNRIQYSNKAIVNILGKHVILDYEFVISVR